MASPRSRQFLNELRIADKNYKSTEAEDNEEMQGDLEIFGGLDLGEVVQQQEFVKYTPTIKIGKEHPGLVVELATLSTVKAPVIDYQLAIPENCYKGLLSAVQLEAIMHACQTHDKEGNHGFLIGDGDGVGTNIIISGIIYENYLHNRTRILWLSDSKFPNIDARIGLQDIGVSDIPVYLLDNCTYEDIDSPKNNIKDGVLVASYNLLTSKNRSQKSRSDQLQKWLSKEPGSLIIFDECLSKNMSALTVKVAVDLQNRLTNARIIYTSKKGTSEPWNMGYMVGLGLWGARTPFSTFQEFQTAEKKSVEEIAKQMKQRGSYVARNLNFKGSSFRIDTFDPSNQFTESESYNKWWDDAEKKFEKACSSSRDTEDKMWTQYWPARSGFFQQLKISDITDRCVEICKEAIKANKAVVIRLQSLGESDEGKDLDYSPAALMNKVLDSHFESSDSTLRLDPSKKRSCDDVSEPLDLSTFLAEIRNSLPPNALDKLIKELGGPSKVAEISGRKVRLGGNVRCKGSDSEKSLKDLNVREMKKFLNGKRSIAIISEASIKGESLKMKKKTANKEMMHIVLQLPLRGYDLAIQQLGHTHWSNPANEYVFIINEMATEKLVSAVTKSLKSLGAHNVGTVGDP